MESFVYVHFFRVEKVRPFVLALIVVTTLRNKARIIEDWTVYDDLEEFPRHAYKQSQVCV